MCGMFLGVLLPAVCKCIEFESSIHHITQNRTKFKCDLWACDICLLCVVLNHHHHRCAVRDVKMNSLFENYLRKCVNKSFSSWRLPLVHYQFISLEEYFAVKKNKIPALGSSIVFDGFFCENCRGWQTFQTGTPMWRRNSATRRRYLGFVLARHFKIPDSEKKKKKKLRHQKEISWICFSKGTISWLNFAILRKRRRNSSYSAIQNPEETFVGWLELNAKVATNMKLFNNLNKQPPNLFIT